ncbi:hypothetical protein IAU59_000630 [Kwoniella sp. CBS 9459]
MPPIMSPKGKTMFPKLTVPFRPQTTKHDRDLPNSNCAIYERSNSSISEVENQLALTSASHSPCPSQKIPQGPHIYYEENRLPSYTSWDAPAKGEVHPSSLLPILNIHGHSNLIDDLFFPDKCPELKDRDLREYPIFDIDLWLWNEEHLPEAERRPFLVHLTRLQPRHRAVNRMCEATDDLVYQIYKVLARGTQGHVLLLKAVDEDNPLDDLVMKVLSTAEGCSPEFQSMTLRELEAARWLADERVPERFTSVFPKYYAFRALNPGLENCIFMERVTGGDLSSYLMDRHFQDTRPRQPQYTYLSEQLTLPKRNGDFGLEDRIKMCLDLLDKVKRMNECLSVMFGQDIFYGDLKPLNILVHNDGGLRIADLGMLIDWSEIVDRREREIMWGTEEYMPAEVLIRALQPTCPEKFGSLCRKHEWLFERVTKPMDRDLEMWSIGATLLAIIHPSLQHPWHPEREHGRLSEAFERRRWMELNFEQCLNIYLLPDLPEDPRYPIHKLTAILRTCFLEPGQRTNLVDLTENLNWLLTPHSRLWRRLQLSQEYDEEIDTDSLYPPEKIPKEVVGTVDLEQDDQAKDRHSPKLGDRQDIVLERSGGKDDKRKESPRGSQKVKRQRSLSTSWLYQRYLITGFPEPDSSINDIFASRRTPSNEPSLTSMSTVDLQEDDYQQYHPLYRFPNENIQYSTIHTSDDPSDRDSMIAVPAVLYLDHGDIETDNEGAGAISHTGYDSELDIPYDHDYNPKPNRGNNDHNTHDSNQDYNSDADHVFNRTRYHDYYQYCGHQYTHYYNRYSNQDKNYNPDYKQTWNRDYSYLFNDRGQFDPPQHQMTEESDDSQAKKRDESLVQKAVKILSILWAKRKRSWSTPPGSPSSQEQEQERDRKRLGLVVPFRSPSPAGTVRIVA